MYSQCRGVISYLPQFEPGSPYMPFSSDLNFLGNPIPYWYYVSGNNIAKQQVPSQQNMETQLAQFINQNIRNCDFGNFTEQNFQISMGQPTTDVIINPSQIQITLNMNLNITKRE